MDEEKEIPLSNENFPEASPHSSAGEEVVQTLGSATHMGFHDEPALTEDQDGDETGMEVLDGGDYTSADAEEVHQTLGSATPGELLNQSEITEDVEEDETRMGVFEGGDNTLEDAEEVTHSLGSVTHRAELNEPEITEVEEGESEESIDRNEDFQVNTSLGETPSSSNRKKVISIPHPVKPNELESKVDISGTNVYTNPRSAADGDIHQEEIHEGDMTGAQRGDETSVGVFDGGDNTWAAAEEVSHTIGSAILNETEIIIEVQEGDESSVEVHQIVRSEDVHVTLGELINQSEDTEDVPAKEIHGFVSLRELLNQSENTESEISEDVEGDNNASIVMDTPPSSFNPMEVISIPHLVKLYELDSLFRWEKLGEGSLTIVTEGDPKITIHHTDVTLILLSSRIKSTIFHKKEADFHLCWLDYERKSYFKVEFVDGGDCSSTWNRIHEILEDQFLPLDAKAVMYVTEDASRARRPKTPIWFQQFGIDMVTGAFWSYAFQIMLMLMGHEDSLLLSNIAVACTVFIILILGFWQCTWCLSRQRRGLQGNGRIAGFVGILLCFLLCLAGLSWSAYHIYMVINGKHVKAWHHITLCGGGTLAWFVFVGLAREMLSQLLTSFDDLIHPPPPLHRPSPADSV